MVEPMSSTEDGSSLQQLDDEALWVDDWYYFGPVETTSFIATHIASAIGLLSAICLLLETRLSKAAVHRNLYWMSFGLILASFASLFGTLPSSDPDFWGAAGNHATCSLQGFALTFGGIWAVLWDMALSVSFLLVVKYSWTDQRISKLIRYLHLVIWPVVLAISVPPLFLELYNPDYDLCWITTFPTGCGNDDYFDCERGDQNLANLFFELMILNLAVGMLVSIACMIALYCHVREVEKRSNRYSFQSAAWSSASASRPRESMSESESVTANRSSLASRASTMSDDRRRSRAVAIQGIAYSTTIIVANVPYLLTLVIDPTWFLVLANVCRHLYGFYYMLLYAKMQPHMKTACGRLLRKVLLRCYSCCQRDCFGACKRRQHGEGGNSNQQQPQDHNPSLTHMATEMMDAGSVATKTEEHASDVDKEMQKGTLVATNGNPDLNTTIRASNLCKSEKDSYEMRPPERTESEDAMSFYVSEAEAES